jgi:ATP-dependent helicase IRC3
VRSTRGLNKTKMSIVLRDFQREALEAVIGEYHAGVTRQLVNLPTGSGKTIVMAAVAKHFNQRTLILAHREELLTQAVDKIKLYWPQASIGIVKGEKDEFDSHIVVGSVQTCCRPKRLEALKKQGFKLLLIDECHHAMASTYQDIIASLGFADGSGLMVGVTATAMRGDQLGLGDLFQKITFARSISTMIRAGYLSPVVGRKILTNFTLEQIKTSNGDYDISELSEAVNTPERNAFIVEKFLAYARERKAIAFCVDVQHCKDLADAFKRAEITCEAVYGAMPPDERKAALDGLKTGRVQVLTSCGLLVEGFDEPSINAVIMARPTKSAGLYVQCVGRGLRLHPAKENCLVLDYTDLGHNLDSAMNLTNTIPEAFCIKEEAEEEFEGEEEAEKIDRSPKIGSVETSDRPFDILGQARFCWVQVGEEWSLLDDDKREIVMSPVEGGYTAKVYYPDGTASQIISSALPLPYAQGVAEDYARRHLKVGYADLGKPWMSFNCPPTPGQRSYLEKEKAFVEGMSKAQAAVAIRKIVATKNQRRRMMASEPITIKQKYALINSGIDPTNMNKMQAMQAIAKIKQRENAYNG